MCHFRPRRPLNAVLPALLLTLSVAGPGCEPRVDNTVDPSAADAATGSEPDTGEAPAPSSVADVPEPSGGVFAMQADDVEIEPAGCRIAREGQWSFELPLPTGGAWTGIERFDQHATEYACSGSTQDFECTTQQGFDYGSTGLDADVSLVVRYTGAWSEADRIAGDVDLVFACEGSACDEVAEQWTVTTFPCASAGPFDGTLQ